MLPFLSPASQAGPDMRLDDDTLLRPHYAETPSPFAMEEETFRALGQHALELAAAYLRALPDGPVYQPLPAGERALLEQLPLPEQGSAPEAILAFYQQHILPWGRAQNHPQFAAFVDPAAAPISMVAAFLAAVTNTSGSGGNYAMAYVEQTVVRWLMELLGFPTGDSDGVLLGGGSDANRHGIECARMWGAACYGWNARADGLAGHPPLVLYASPERHSCIDKAAFTLGLGKPREVQADAEFRMDARALRAAIREDRAAGHLPCLVVASAGTVRSGAIDPLDEIADVCESEQLWLHVDGAFGGLGAVDPRLSNLYKGMERANSLAIDPHKWGAVAIGCSCVLVRPAHWLADTYKLVPDYLRFQSGNVFADGPWFSHRSAEQTRESGRALKTLWTIQQTGRAGIVAHVQRHIDLAAYMRQLIEGSFDLELVAAGSLPAICFRAVPLSLRGDEAALNRLNQALMARLQTEGRAFLAGVEITTTDTAPTPGTGTASYDDTGGNNRENEDEACHVQVQGRYALRSCALHYALTERHIEALLDEVRRVAALCLAEEAEEAAGSTAVGAME